MGSGRGRPVRGLQWHCSLLISGCGVERAMLSTEMESSAVFPSRLERRDVPGRRGYTAETGQPQRDLPGRKVWNLAVSLPLDSFIRCRTATATYAPLCPSVTSVVKKRTTAGRPCDVVSQPPGERPTLNHQHSSRRCSPAALSLFALLPPVKPARARLGAKLPVPRGEIRWLFFEQETEATEEDAGKAGPAPSRRSPRI
jgi:hypothetical protein